MSLIKLLISVLFLLQTLGAESYRQWMKSHDLREEIYNYYGDFDSDGISNALEYFLGTNPLEKSKQCLRPKIKEGLLHVEHDISTTTEDIKVEYLWSKDLITYQTSGEAAPDGTVAVITQTPGNIGLSSVAESTYSETTREVSAEIIQGEANAVYIKMVVTNTAVVSWGSDTAFGGALFSNASAISLVDTNLNILSGTIAVDFDPYGI